MSITASSPTGNVNRAARGRFVWDALKSERWSVRAASHVIGMSNSALSDRVNGKAPFIAEDLESIAIILKRNPVEFYGQYLRAGTKKGPASEETGPESENAPVAGESYRSGFVRPPGLEPGTHWIRDSKANKPARPRNRADRSTGPKSRKR